MLFQSQVFILAFLPAVLVAYYALAGREVWREYALIAASLVFYGWWDVALRAAPDRPDHRVVADRRGLSAPPRPA